MSRTKRAQLAILTFTAFAVTGCGITPADSRSPAYYSVQAQGNSSATTDTEPTPTPGPTGPALPAPHKVVLRGNGYNGMSFVVRTGTVLRFRFAPGQQDRKFTNSSGQEELPAYSKLGVQITVNGFTYATEMLDNGLVQGTTPETGSVIDFTGKLPNVCDGQGSDCRQDVKVTIDKPNNDYYCLNAWMYCPFTRIPDGHPWNGTLQVQTDETAAL